jgi:hypothetical protein
MPHTLLISLAAFLLFIACEEKPKPQAVSSESKDTIAIENLLEKNKDSVYIKEHEENITDNAESKNDTITLNDLYEKLYLFPLPLSLSQIEDYDSTKETSVPKSLIPAFGFQDDYYDNEFLLIAKLPEYRNFKIIIARAYRLLSGADELHLCTFLNDTIIDYITIYSASEAEYNERTDALYIKSFSIAKNYEISIKSALYPDLPNKEHELNVTRNMYIVNDEGKFVKK